MNHAARVGRPRIARTLPRMTDEQLEQVAASQSSWMRLREKLTEHCEPGQVGWACALGAAIGVAPIPGLQLIAATILAWKLKLNLAIVLLVSNISLGPLLLIWAAVSASLGRCLRTGAAPWALYDSFHRDFTDAGSGVAQFFLALGHCFSDWLLGSVVIMPVVGLIFGMLGYLFALALQTRRRS